MYIEPKEWNGKEQKFQVSEWLNLDYAEIKGQDMSRHFLILGETGSGKTKSAIIPLLNSILTYSEESRPSLLVIDPKNELYSKIKLHKNVINFNQSYNKKKEVIHFFEGLDLEDISSDEIKSKIFNLFPNIRPVDFFIRQAELCIKSFIEIDLYSFNSGGADQVESLWQNFIAHCKKSPISSGAEKFPDFGDTRHIALCAQIVKKLQYDASNYFEKFNYLINEIDALQLFLEYWASTDDKVASLQNYNFLNSLVSLRYNATEQLSGVVGTVNNYFGVLCSKGLVNIVSLNPFVPPKEKLSIAKCMNEGWCVVYSPEQNSDIGDLIGRCIKSKFFEYTFKRENQDRPFAYVCDEFQRFITADRASGEQSFLDRCRAFKAICVLASQSLASLTHTLSTGYAREGAVDSSINVILNNTGNKLFFRNTDIDTITKLEKLIPTPFKQGKPHIIQVRPPSTLSVGECYYLLSNGKWGRGKVSIKD
ncbi:MAG: DUF87 domain-containing protein [Bacteroidetes bacterium]|nr:DUF87 domain-containing protein [Bacteroidota bacterium]